MSINDKIDINKAEVYTPALSFAYGRSAFLNASQACAQLSNFPILAAQNAVKSACTLSRSSYFLSPVSVASVPLDKKAAAFTTPIALPLVFHFKVRFVQGKLITGRKANKPL